MALAASRFRQMSCLLRASTRVRRRRGALQRGQDGLSLQACNGGGNNNDVPKLSLMFQAAGKPTTLASVALPGLTTFIADSWYRVTMALSVVGDTWTVNGSFNNHAISIEPRQRYG